MPERSGSYASDLRGVSRLIIDATSSVTEIVEGMHYTIQRVPGIVGEPPAGRTRGITGLVYGAIRGTTGAVGKGLDLALKQLAPLLPASPDAPERVHVQGALCGVMGDYLETTKNPLSVPMQLCADGRALRVDPDGLRAALVEPTGKVVVLVHGLCMNDLLWRRGDVDYGAWLARDLGYTPVYLRYNTGRHISTNGRRFGELLRQLVESWPVPVEALSIVGHSMGGLVTRSAIHYDGTQAQAFCRHLRHVVFVGTPHHGAPLERGGRWLHVMGQVSPYTAPLARLGNIRSAGITDLRFGNLLDSDWLGTDRFVAGDDRRSHVPLPEAVACHAIAGRLLSGSATASGLGDGLVPVASALGRHPDATRSLPLAAKDRLEISGVGHIELMGSRRAYAAIRQWLASS